MPSGLLSSGVTLISVTRRHCVFRDGDAQQAIVAETLLTNRFDFPSNATPSEPKPPAADGASSASVLQSRATLRLDELVELAK